MASLPGADLAASAVHYDTLGETQLAIDNYIRAADVIEYAAQSGQAPDGYDFPKLARDYRARASELAAQGSQTDSTSGKLEATASSMFRKLKASASSAARATKEAAQNVGQGAQSAASAVYVSTAAGAKSTAKAANKRGTLTNIMATTAASGAGWGFGTTVGHGVGAGVVRTIFPAPPRRR
jgi:hypothetical protein